MLLRNTGVILIQCLNWKHRHVVVTLALGVFVWLGKYIRHSSRRASQGCNFWPEEWGHVRWDHKRSTRPTVAEVCDTAIHLIGMETFKAELNRIYFQWTCVTDSTTPDSKPWTFYFLTPHPKIGKQDWQPVVAVTLSYGPNTQTKNIPCW